MLQHEVSLSKHVLKRFISFILWNKMWRRAQLIHLVDCKKKNSLVLGQWSDNLRLTLIALLGEAKCFLASISDKCVGNVPVRGAV